MKKKEHKRGLKSLRIDGELHQSLKVTAAQKGIPLSVYVEKVLARHFLISWTEKQTAK